MIFVWIQLDVWKEPSAPGHVVDIHMPKDKISSFEKLLTAHGMSYRIMVPDVEDLLNEEELSNMKNSFYSSYDYTKYNQWSEVDKNITHHLVLISTSSEKIVDFDSNKLS